MINIHNSYVWRMKKGITSSEMLFLRELYKFEEEGKILTEERFSMLYNYSPRQIKNIVKSLENKGYIKKIKDGWFIKEYQLTENGKRIIQNY